MSEPAHLLGWRLLAPLALMTGIFILSAQSDPGPDVGSAGRVIAHFSEYALLAALWAWALAPALGGRALLPAAGAISLLYAVSDEYHQSFVAGREADPFDVAVDAAGIAFALTAISLVARARRRGRDPRTAHRAPAPPA